MPDEGDMSFRRAVRKPKLHERDGDANYDAAVYTENYIEDFVMSVAVYDDQLFIDTLSERIACGSLDDDVKELVLELIELVVKKATEGQNA